MTIGQTYDEGSHVKDVENESYEQTEARTKRAPLLKIQLHLGDDVEQKNGEYKQARSNVRRDEDLPEGFFEQGHDEVLLVHRDTCRSHYNTTRCKRK